jgi:NAD(P)-dependent dehydrogenase (short-subunit alcohol dehydrogenase family)
VIDLSGRHVLVVGGSRGIGAEAARQAHAAGAAVTVTYGHNADAADAVVAELGERAQADAHAAVAAGLDRFGRLDGVVVSAGVFEPSRIEDMTPQFFDRVMAVNVRGTFLAVQAAIPPMRSAGGGSVVIYTSTAGQRGSSDYSAYAMSKGAQILFMRSAAMELAPDRIRVNCIAPAWTDSDMSRGPIDEIGREDVVAACPLGRIGTPADIAAATCFLLSDLASYVTGSTMTVDGGQDFRG